MNCRICGNPAPNGIMTGALCDECSKKEQQARRDAMKKFSTHLGDYIERVDLYVENILKGIKQ